MCGCSPAEYRFVLKGATVGDGELKTHYLLAMDPGNVTAPIDGLPTKEPAFGLDALWVQETDKERAQFSGYTVVDLSDGGHHAYYGTGEQQYA